MRILRLRIRNIASLKGEHEVDFLEIQKESSLFAITGETGAGKSSILNCIGLALYGNIYKKNVQQIDVVTLGEKDGSIELIFQIKGKNYLADWRVRVRKQNGELYSTPQSPVRNIYSLEGDDFSSPKQISSLGAAELLNLDFDQFCKCIILNQGEFAKFLTSSFTDRKDILEKLYPGELLDSLGRELKNELDSLGTARHELDIKLNELRGEGPSGEELKIQEAALKKELEVHESSLKSLEVINGHFISLLSYFDKYKESEQKKEIIQKDLTELTTKYNHLLKEGEEVHERWLQTKKAQETELPLLQVFLQKEETLKHLEEGWRNLSKKDKELSSSLEVYNEKLKNKVQEEAHRLSKLESVKSLLKFSPEALKKDRENIDRLFELFAEIELLQEERKGKAERLLQLETSGKELKAVLEEKENALKLIPANIKELEKKAEMKKQENALKIDQKQRAEIQYQEIKKGIEKNHFEIQEIEERQLKLKTFIDNTREEILPLETTLKLQEVLNAKEVCLDHALTSGKEECPVCENPVNSTQWSSLKMKLSSMDLKNIRIKFDEKSRELYQSVQEEEHLSKKVRDLRAAILKKENELIPLEALRNSPLPTPQDIEKELETLRKQSWEFETLSKEVQAKKEELQKIREQYVKVKTESAEREKLLAEKTTKFELIKDALKDLIPEVSKDTVRDLKAEMRNLTSYLEEESLWIKVLQEKEFLHKEKEREAAEIEKIKLEQESQLQKITVLKVDLEKNLNGEKASSLIEKLNFAAKAASDAWNARLDEQKKQELQLKGLESRLIQLDELKKDFDLQYRKELHFVKESASSSTHSEVSRLKDLSLDFSSPRELFIPLKDLLEAEKENGKKLCNECRMNFAAVSARLADWEKLQDKILLLELKKKETQEALGRKERLFEVLGRDDLRTFVLSLVEESLIHQTNEELQKLCQGRYEIVHQTKSMRMAPEFYILDKFRDGGKRKVSTLSGGETFMVSLAMALGLAEMTRGQTEIDSLFIDEGFGTLDQDSLEDVLEMLQQIQTRGLMVGIISHIKALTSSIPVNLVLSKGRDGSSSVSLRRN